ncbi:MAG: HDIG domain-containing protein [Firmicutes bacterium]|nr:HDIG domain-containing protein [Bacillota bacterium]
MRNLKMDKVSAMARAKPRLAAILAKYQLRTNRRFRLAVYALFIAALFVLLIGSALPQRYNLAVGQVSSATITAAADVVDTQATQAARNAAAALVPARYNVDPSVLQRALSRLDQLFATAQGLRSDVASHGHFNLTKRRVIEPTGFPTSVMQALLTLSNAQFTVVSSDSIRITQTLLQSQFSQSDLDRSAMIVDQQLVNLDVDKPTRLVIGQIVQGVLRPNLIYNPVLTKEARMQAQRAVPDIWIYRGDVVVRRGQLITQSIMGQLQDLGLLKTIPNYGVYGAFLVFLFLMIGAMASFIQLRRARVAKDNVYLLLYVVIIVLVAVLIRLARAGVDAGLPSGISYALPIATGSMMITLFFGSSLAMLSSLLLAILTSAAFGFQFAYFFAALISTLGATMAMTRVQHRSVFMRAGFFAGLVNVVAILTTHFLLTSAVSWGELAYDMLYGAVAGPLSAVLTIGLLPFLEATFGITTHMGLLELANPNNPLLRKLLLEAPGTYHHSLIVGNLAEAAAEVIGADPLICRVGAYYHDVGKMKRPVFFIENQMSGENPHDKIAPNLSYLIVAAHVSDGLEMLREHNLPEPVKGICAEHHGTTVMWYFYNKALEDDKHGAVTPEQFRYPGPKPQTKEAAIVMMCDAVEAAVRSIGKPTPPRIEAMIRKIIKDRLQDGQLDECDITLRDLDRMVEAFMRTLKGIYHERIEYPDAVKVAVDSAKRP